MASASLNRSMGFVFNNSQALLYSVNIAFVFFSLSPTHFDWIELISTCKTSLLVSFAISYTDAVFPVPGYP